MLIPSEGQELALNFAEEKRYSTIAMKPGQGKTLVAVEMAIRNRLDALVVCPGYAKNEWVKHFNLQSSELHITIFNKHKDLYPLWDSGVAIMSYDLIYNPRIKDAPKDSLTQPIFEWADIVIADEVHYLKEMENKRSYYFHKLLYENNPDYFIGLSGTPAKNRTYELFSPITLCSYKKDDSPFRNKFPHWIKFANYFSFPKTRKIKTKRGRFITQTTYSGLKNEEELKAILNCCYFTLPKKYEFKLKDPIYHYVEADKMKKMPKLWPAFESFIKENKKTAPDIKAQAAELTAPYSAKLAEELYETHGAIVIFTDHVKSSEIIAERLGVKAINGNVPIKKRGDILKDFQDGNSRFIVATVGTLSTAISLVTSKTMILNDAPWVPGDLEQTEKRIRRKGQEETCIYYRVLATPQSEKIYKALDEKQKVLDKIDNLAGRV